jgi:hypothetical protein
MSTEPDELINELKKLNDTLSRIADLFEFSLDEEIENALADIFSNPRDRKIYELSDGTRSTRDIGKIINLDQKGISNLWKAWAEIGIVESTGHLKPYKAKHTLIELAKIYKKKTKGK